MNFPPPVSKPSTEATVRLPPERFWLAPFTVVASVCESAVRLTLWASIVALSMSMVASSGSPVVVIPSPLSPSSLRSAAKVRSPLPRSIVTPLSTLIVSAFTVRFVPWAT